MRTLSLAAALAGLASVVAGLGQKQIIGFGAANRDSFQLAGRGVNSGQILVSSDDYWGVIRAAGDLGLDFGRVTGTNYTLSNGKRDAKPAKFDFDPVDVKDNTKFATTKKQSFEGPPYANPDPAKTVIIAGTIGHSKYIDDIVRAGKIDVSKIKGKWESFVTKVVKDPVPGVPEALVIAGSMPRGTIYGIYDISEQIGVSPWYFWADVAIKKNKDIHVRRSQKTQGAPSVKFRGLFLNDEQPGLSSWVGTNFPDAWNGAAGYNHDFYALVCELLLRLRANYLWPTLWGSMVYTDDPFNQPLVYAYEVVLGSSHTEPLMRAQNEFGTYYKGPWAYNLNNKTIDEYFEYGVQRAKPYARNSLWTMAMRGTGDTAIEGLGIDVIVTMLEQLVHNQREIIAKGLGVDDISEVPQSWCLYKEVQSYQERGLEIPEDITLLWSDDNWGNIRRMPLKSEQNRKGGAGVYYHFDYVGDPRDYKWINTIQLEKTAEQMNIAYARKADRIWIVNVGDLKPLEIPISHFLDLAYDHDRWGGIDNTQEWLRAWIAREFDEDHVDDIASILTRYGMFAARRKFELVDEKTYSVLNYNEADTVLAQWKDLEADAQGVYDALGAEHKAAFFEMVLHPVTGGRILTEIYIAAAKNNAYALQKRNTANDFLEHARALLDEDAELTQRWDELLSGKWKHMLDQTHIGYDNYWQQPMRNTLPAMSYVQSNVVSLAGHVRFNVEGSNASVSGDDKFHPNSGNVLVLPPLDPYGPITRYFDVFNAGTKACEWKAAVGQPWLKLSKTGGTVRPDGGADERVSVSVDWSKAPKVSGTTTVQINLTTPCWGLEKYAVREPILQVPVVTRSVPGTFKEGFVEADGHVAIEAPHYQRVVEGKNSKAKYHTLKNYGRNLGGVSLVPADLDKLDLEAAPALEYSLYLFSNHTAANVTLYLSPSHNYLTESNPLEYAVALYPAGERAPASPQRVRFVGPTKGASMPDGWGTAVADAVWGVRTNTSTSSFPVGGEGAYTLRVWALMPSVVVQKVVVDLGGVRPSYLGPPESFLVGRDRVGEYDATRATADVNSACIHTPSTLLLVFSILIQEYRAGHDIMGESGQSSITVAVRVRPFTIREAAQLQKNDDGTLFLGDGSLAAAPAPKLHQRGIRNVIKVVDDRCLVFDPPEDSPVQKFSRSVLPTSKKVKDQVFAFDRVFDENTTQAEVYEGTTRSLLDSVLDGYNATVFAYGATGCGKTHTITGTSQQPGIIFLTMQELFEKIEERSQDKVTELSLSYLEIYNETIRDLLVPGGNTVGPKAGLMLREDSNQAVTVSGLTSHHPKDVQEVMDMIVQGNEYRTVSPTEANATSSRSHAVLQINVAQKDRNADVNEPHTMATLSIIDLAGSERASVTKNRGERLTEGANINKSLLALGSCINALCDRRQKAHVPYRNSKLTRLLKFSLGGNCKTVMIVCVSPSSAHYDESQNTLRYANRAKNIQTKVTRNVFNVNRHVKDFLVKIDEQMALINELKAQQKDAEAIFFTKFRKQWEKRDATAREGIQRLRAAYDNSAAERQERINCMKKLRAFERRIGLLSGWIAAFDTVCDQRGDEDAMPQNLTAIRKTVQGILVELENSRYHMHQKLEKASWERALESALTHSIKLLECSEGADAGEVETLTKEAELLKSNFNREAHHEVLEQERVGDAAMVQMLLTAQFDILSSLSDTLSMDEDAAVTHAKGIINRLLNTGYTAASQVVKPDGSLPVVEAFPPVRKGTPKKKKVSGMFVKPPVPPAVAAVQSEHSYLSPMKSSPRRRKALALTKKGVSFTPVKKSKPRGVRWRDDETEEGTLADFEKTPKKFAETTPEQPFEPKKLFEEKKTFEEKTVPLHIVEPIASIPEESMVNVESSPSLEIPEATSLGGSKPSRFQAGFLSKGPRKSLQQDGSPVAPQLQLNLMSSSPASDSTPPLRSLDVAKTGNLSPPGFSLRKSDIGTRRSLHTIPDENAPPRHSGSASASGSGSGSGSGSDSESNMIDARKLRSAMHSAMREKVRRASLLTGTTASNAKRVSSIGSIGGSRPSMSGNTASSTNGISRHRRGSSERRRSPPMACSPPDWKPDRSFTPGQARRMNLVGSVRVENHDGSPRDGTTEKNRRVTIGVGPGSVAGHRRQESRGSMAWR
ncbi:Kinesin-like protein 6 [Paramyrothecium foliicola]|nr:Kinesin-like protein 6 [Paramyrothecium foliicola]